MITLSTPKKLFFIPTMPNLPDKQFNDEDKKFESMALAAEVRNMDMAFLVLAYKSLLRHVSYIALIKHTNFPQSEIGEAQRWSRWRDFGHFSGIPHLPHDLVSLCFLLLALLLSQRSPSCCNPFPLLPPSSSPSLPPTPGSSPFLRR